MGYAGEPESQTPVPAGAARVMQDSEAESAIFYFIGFCFKPILGCVDLQW